MGRIPGGESSVGRITRKVHAAADRIDKPSTGRAERQSDGPPANAASGAEQLRSTVRGRAAISHANEGAEAAAANPSDRSARTNVTDRGVSVAATIDLTLSEQLAKGTITNSEAETARDKLEEAQAQADLRIELTLDSSEDSWVDDGGDEEPLYDEYVSTRGLKEWRDLDETDKLVIAEQVGEESLRQRDAQDELLEGRIRTNGPGETDSIVFSGMSADERAALWVSSYTEYQLNAMERSILSGDETPSFEGRIETDKVDVDGDADTVTGIEGLTDEDVDARLEEIRVRNSELENLWTVVGDTFTDDEIASLRSGGEAREDGETGGYTITDGAGNEFSAPLSNSALDALDEGRTSDGTNGGVSWATGDKPAGTFGTPGSMAALAGDNESTDDTAAGADGAPVVDTSQGVGDAAYDDATGEISDPLSIPVGVDENGDLVVGDAVVAESDIEWDSDSSQGSGDSTNGTVEVDSPELGIYEATIASSTYTDEDGVDQVEYHVISAAATRAPDGTTDEAESDGSDASSGRGPDRRAELLGEDREDLVVTGSTDADGNPAYTIAGDPDAVVTLQGDWEYSAGGSGGSVMVKVESDDPEKGTYYASVTGSFSSQGARMSVAWAGDLDVEDSASSDTEEPADPDAVPAPDDAASPDAAGGVVIEETEVGFDPGANVDASDPDAWMDDTTELSVDGQIVTVPETDFIPVVKTDGTESDDVFKARIPLVDEAGEAYSIEVLRTWNYDENNEYLSTTYEYVGLASPLGTDSADETDADAVDETVDNSQDAGNEGAPENTESGNYEDAGGSWGDLGGGSSTSGGGGGYSSGGGGGGGGYGSYGGGGSGGGAGYSDASDAVGEVASETAAAQAAGVSTSYAPIGSGQPLTPSLVTPASQGVIGSSVFQIQGIPVTFTDDAFAVQPGSTDAFASVEINGVTIIVARHGAGTTEDPFTYELLDPATAKAGVNFESIKLLIQQYQEQQKAAQAAAGGATTTGANPVVPGVVGAAGAPAAVGAFPGTNTAIAGSGAAAPIVANPVLPAQPAIVVPDASQVTYINGVPVPMSSSVGGS